MKKTTLTFLALATLTNITIADFNSDAPMQYCPSALRSPKIPSATFNASKPLDTLVESYVISNTALKGDLKMQSPLGLDLEREE